MNHTRPKLEGFTGIIDAILEADKDPAVPRKQRHTAHRIFERLRDEHGFTGGYTIVKDYVRSQRQSVREAFVPLHHPPGHAQIENSARRWSRSTWISPDRSVSRDKSSTGPAGNIVELQIQAAFHPRYREDGIVRTLPKVMAVDWLGQTG